MSWIASNDYLDEADMQNNATELFNYLNPLGWTVNCIAAMLGNIEIESTVNPGLWEGRHEGNMNGGFGLVQWTPASDFIDWAGSNYATGERQCERFVYELDNHLQYYPNPPDYPLTFREFTQSTDEDIAYLVRTFLYNYERPKSPDVESREAAGIKWYEFLTGITPVLKKKSKWIFYMKRRF